MLEDVNQILTQIVFSINKESVGIDFDFDRKMFVLSVPVYEAKKMAYSVEKYIEARRDRIFLPHATSFVRNGESVLLVQKIPFQWGVSLNTRKDILDFLQLGKRCHALLHELALEEQYQAALDALLTE